MLALLLSVLFCPAQESESVAALLEKAGPMHAKEARIEALKELVKSRPKDPERVCQMLEKVLKDKDPEIRSEAMVSLGLVASGAKLECPLSIVEAIDDADGGVRSHAQGLVHLFKKFPQEAVPLVFKAADSQDVQLRDFAGAALPLVAGKTPEVIKKLKALMNDSNEFVRHNAHIAHHEATKDFKAFVTYLLGYSSNLNPPHPTDTEQQQKDQVRRNLTLLGTAIFFYNASRERPKEFADVLIGNLSHHKTTVRQASLLQLRAMAIGSQESYHAIPKVKAQAEVAKLFKDNNKEIREWARWVQTILNDGPPPDAPKKLEPLDTLNPLPSALEQGQTPPAGVMP